MMLKRIFVTFFLVIMSLCMSARDVGGQVEGSVRREDGQPLSGANVSLVGSSGKIVAGTVSDATGHFMLEAVEPGQYRLEIHYVGFRPFSMGEVSVADGALKTSLGQMAMREDVKSLSEVTVVGDITTIENGTGKKTVHVGRDLQTSGNASKDLLNNIPSLQSDAKGNILLRGNDNVRFYIDDSPTNLSSNELLNLLPSMDIERIEVVTTPSVKDYPDGMSGVVNIITKKGNEKGLNADVQLGAGTHDKFNGDIALNYRTNKVNVYAGYTYFRNISDFTAKVASRDYDAEGSSLAALRTENEVEGYYLGTLNQLKGGVDYFISPKADLSYSISYRNAVRENDVDIATNKYATSDAPKDNTASQSSFSKSRMNVLTNHIRFNYVFNAVHRISASINYEMDNTKQEGVFSRKAKIPMGPMGVVNQNLVQINTYHNDYKFMSGRIDYQYNKKRFGMEYGLSANVRMLDNPYMSDATIEFDPQRPPAMVNQRQWENTQYSYDERVVGLYGLLSYKTGRFSLQGGVRGEYTGITLESEDRVNPDKQHATNDYFSWYPSVNISYKPNERHELILNYSRRVARPDTRQLNPNRVLTNPDRPSIGNPYLDAQFSNSVELGYLRDWMGGSINFNTFFRYNTDIIQPYLTQINPVTGKKESLNPAMPQRGYKTFSTFSNFGDSYFIGLEVIASQRLWSWLSLMGSVNAYYVEYDNSEDKMALNRSGVNWDAKLTANFHLAKGLNAMLLGRYSGIQTTIQSVEEGNGSVDVGIRQDLFRNKMSVSLRLTDVFNTEDYKSRATVINSISDQGRTYEQQLTHESYESRVAYLTLSYRF